MANARSFLHTICLCAAGGVALMAALPASADVKAGVEAWTAGDFAAAVSEWLEPAARGDPDAQFNLAQAYRLGRGVEVDLGQAEALYAKAAAQGHLKAADNYGLLLFQDGRREAAMPYLAAASQRGDPRAQYLIGLAHFNGDLLPRDWVRAYALLTLSNSAGLPQAAPAIRQMDEFIPRDQREQAQLLAQTLKRESDAARASQLAAADLGVDVPGQDYSSPSPVTAPANAAATSLSANSNRAAAGSPLLVSAKAAISEAARVTGTESPVNAGADLGAAATKLARESASQSASQSAAQRTGQAAAAPATAPTSSSRYSPSQPQVSPHPPSVERKPAAPTAIAAPAGSGPWKIQLGAFSVDGNAEKLWRQLSSRSELAGRTRLIVPSGRLTRLLAAGYPTRAAAEQACASLKRSGLGCLVIR